jgi:hypothetical protein
MKTTQDEPCHEVMYCRAGVLGRFGSTVDAVGQAKMAIIALGKVNTMTHTESRRHAQVYTHTSV